MIARRKIESPRGQELFPTRNRKEGRGREKFLAKSRREEAVGVEIQSDDYSWNLAGKRLQFVRTTNATRTDVGAVVVRECAIYAER